MHLANAPKETRSTLGARVKLASLMTGIAVAGLVATSGTASAASGAPVMMAGNQWLGGHGASICGSSSAPTCNGETHVGGGTSNVWQCVELAQRVYKENGWYTGIFPGVSYAYQIYDQAPTMGMSRTPNGSVTNVYAGDMVIMSHSTGNQMGHVAVIDHVTNNSDGTKTIVAGQQNVPSSVWINFRWHGGTLDMPAGWSGYSIRGVVHSPKDTMSAASQPSQTPPQGNGSPQDVNNGAGTRLVGPNGYMDVSSTGQVYAWNGRSFGNAALRPTRFVDAKATAGDQGYWLVDGAGEVYAFGNAQYMGGSPTLPAGNEIVAMAARPDGRGYFMVNTRGDVYGYSSDSSLPVYFGGTPANYTGKFVDIESTSSGNGYWLLNSTGQVYAYGDAKYAGGSPTGYDRAIVAMSTTPSGNGYVLVSKGGQVYAYGDAQWKGNVPSTPSDIADVSYTSGAGYVMINTAGQHYAFGDAPFVNNPTGFAGMF